MLATRLYPAGAMTVGTARRWVEECPTDEVADQLAMNLLSRLPEAESLMLTLAEAPGRMERYVAMKLASRLAAADMSDATAATIAATAARLMDNPANDMSLRTAAMWAHDNITRHE